MSDFLDDRDFYELMQAYRHSDIADQKGTIEAFEAVKDFVRSNMAQPAPAVQVVLRQPNLFAADPAAPAVNCEWTNCPRRVGDVCCNDRPAAPAVPAVDCRTCARCYSTKGRGVYGCDSVVACSNGDRYQPLPVVQLWRAA